MNFQQSISTSYYSIIKCKLISLLLVFMFMSCSSSKHIDISRYPNTIDIMSFNLRYDNSKDGQHIWGNRKTACINMLKEIQPSIFGIQEGLYHQINEVKKNLPQYNDVGVGREDGSKKGEFASIFYLKSKFILINKGWFWLNSTPDLPLIGWDASAKRIVTWVKLKDLKTNKTILVFNTHFDHKGKLARKESAQLLINKINSLAIRKDIVFITGDFNGQISQSMFKPIKEQFKNAKRHSLQSKGKKSYNAFGAWCGLRNTNIDFIFYRNAYSTQYKTIDKNYGVSFISDHYPIWAEFKY